jgi:hypothetical protein
VYNGLPDQDVARRDASTYRRPDTFTSRNGRDMSRSTRDISRNRSRNALALSWYQKVSDFSRLSGGSIDRLLRG